MQWIERLKQRWGVQSAVRVVLILFIFACTGTSILFIKPVAIHLFFEGQKPTGWGSFVYYLFSPIIYNILLLLYGSLLGQFRFFWEFEKKMFRRTAGWFRRKSSP